MRPIRRRWIGSPGLTLVGVLLPGTVPATVLRKGRFRMTNSTPPRIVARVAAIMLAISTSATLAAAPAAATPLAPTKASQLVSLIAPADSHATCPSAGIPFEETGTNGLRTPFVIPPTMVLIVTSIHFEIFNGTPSTNANGTITSQAIGEDFRIVVAVGAASLDARGNGGGAILIPTGVRVPAGRTVCIQNAGGLTGGLLYGFLAADR